MAGELLVWEWQSESYVMKQQGHVQQLSCLDYSPDGASIATGANDGKARERDRERERETS